MGQVVEKLKFSAELKDEDIDLSTLEDKLGFRIRLIEREMYKNFLNIVGMTTVQYSLFALVAENEGMPQGTIGEALNMDRASTMAVMNKLEKAGLVERKKSLVDRRRHALYLTAKGQKKIITAERKAQETDESFKAKLTKKQLRDLIRCLDILSG